MHCHVYLWLLNICQALLWFPEKLEVMAMCVCVCVYACVRAHVRIHSLLSFVWLFATPPGSSVHGNFQEYWSGLPLPIRGSSDPGIETKSLAYPELAGSFFTTEPPKNPNGTVNFYKTLLLLNKYAKNIKIITFIVFYFFQHSIN